MNNQFDITIEAFDKENSKDPNVEVDAGVKYPKELLYAKRMSDCLNAYYPEASEALLLAVRCQHIRRWEIPRDSFPDNRKGYLLWRTKLKEMHAQIASEIMQQQGYDMDLTNQVVKLLLKKGLKTDPEVQVLEDVICIVFLQYYFSDFALKHDVEKLKSILLKTLKKMSEKGIAHAQQLNNAGEFLPYLQ